MFSVLINTLMHNDPILINYFSRLALIISNNLKGPASARYKKRKHVGMAEQNCSKGNESTSSSRNFPISNTTSNHVSSTIPCRRKPIKKRDKESILVINPVNLVQFANCNRGLPYWQPFQFRNYNLVNGNIPRTVLQSQLSQNYFHRESNEQNQKFGQNMSNIGNVENNFITRLRFWERVTTHNNHNRGFKFTVMSYNVLAQDLLDQHPYLYTLHQRDSLKWQNRWKKLFGEISRFQPDILCLQEVQKSHLESYFAQLERLGYRGLYKQRTGIRSDGCAIYYKHKALQLIEYTSVEYRQPNVQILDRDNVAIMAKFSPVNNNEKQFVVATTHLLYNPKRQDVRLAQIQLLLTELDRLAFTSCDRYLPVILTGDLNSTPDSAVYKFITGGKLKYENLSLRSLQHGVAGPKTGKNFLPKFLKITDQCQHANLLPKRQNNACISRSEELKFIELKHSERVHEEPSTHKYDKINEELFASGTLSHKFSLSSVYQHHVNGDLEGTTFQDEWVSVDYIFFSKHQPNTENLTLLERYRLPTRSELGHIKIPNSNLGSDHLFLLAKFHLKV